jgi:chromosome segregation ATPase
MLGDAIHDDHGGLKLESLESRVKAVENTRTRLTTLRDQIAQDLKEREAEVQHLTSETEILTKVVELFRFLMDQLVEHQVRIVERLGTKGMQSVFPDLDLSLESEVDPKYNKIAVEFFLRKGSPDSPYSHRGSPLESFGGGPSSVISLILRVLAIKKLKRWPLLILDESLAAVSDDYISATGQFIRLLADKIGFDIILVTHKTAFLEHAHAAFRCTEETEENGVSTYVVLRKVS